MATLTTIQLGKNGLTDNFILTLKNHFKKYNNVKVSVLRSCCRDKEELKKISNELVEKLGNHYTSKIIGYTLAIKRWRKPVR
ncbi:YhbY family RNA-binding protein [Candidatus Pacearchaeota archaeon]|nr:YhbY family RNA-binding protein [Candidatus Pacearchaeota archaeon]